MQQDAAVNQAGDRRAIARLLGTVAVVAGICLSAGCKLDRTEVTGPTADVAIDTSAEASSDAGADTDTSATTSGSGSSGTTSSTSSGTSGSGTSSSSTTSTSSTTTTASGADALDLSQVATWILPNVPGVSASELVGARVTATIRSASTNESYLYTSYDPYSFPSSDGTDAICYFFYKKGGKVVGGKFDYWRTGGQGTKTMENVHDGYGGHSMPASGTECWTMISSKDGSQRSNTCAVTWK